MNVQLPPWNIEVTEEAYTRMGTSAHARQHELVYQLGDKHNIPTVIYALRVSGPTDVENTCYVTGDRGKTCLHDRSIVPAGKQLFLAISAWLCCLEVPSLKLAWKQQVDFATCFGVYRSPDGNGLISHGETQIEKVRFAGEMEWVATSKDIFTGDFVLAPDHIDVTDFNNEKYRILISTGHISLVSP